MVTLKLDGVSRDVKGRREFVITLMKAAAGSGLLLLSGAGIAAERRPFQQPFTVQQVIDLILQHIPNTPFPKTVDTIKAGDSNQPVTAIVTTMFATAEVIEKASNLGANFIIAHEPAFYNHNDDTKWLENDEVYKYKHDLLKKHNITVWRCHDYIHALTPDGVLMGVLQAIGWDKYHEPEKPYLVTIPPAPLKSIIQLVKSKLAISHVKVIGDESALCSKVFIAPGAAGGTRQIEAIRSEKPELFICGELNEWETSEYVRDMRYMGAKTSLIVLGHIASEEPGLQWLASWLQPQVAGIKITHIPSTDAFSWA